MSLDHLRTPGDDAGPRALRASPFLDLDDRAGDAHRWRRHICFALLLAIVVAVAWKILAPLPRLLAFR